MFNKKEYMKKWNIKNPEYMKKWWIRNKERILVKRKEYMKEYRKNNREKILLQSSDYFKKYRKKNKDKIKEYQIKWQKNKRRTNLKFKLNDKISIGIYKSLRGNKKCRHWEDLVGYNVIDLIKHLQKTMPEGYTWQDYLKGRLHIDHIIPISAFNFNKPEHPDFKRCWDLKNLRLLPAKENLIKLNKLEKPFQPALQLCLVD